MKYFTILLALIQFSILSNNQVIIVDHFLDAIALSEETEKPILVIFTGDNCKFCDIMKNDLSKHSKILDGYVLCYIDYSNTELVNEYKVKLIPDYFVLDDKIEIKRKVGYKNIEDFKIWLSK